MKTIDTYIQEKLIINKNSKLKDKSNLEVISELINFEPYII